MTAFGNLALAFDGKADEVIMLHESRSVSPQVTFYYVEYGLAQLGAMQIWLSALHDRACAVARYRRALAMGGTASLPELYVAGKFACDADALGATVAFTEKVIGELEEQLEEQSQIR